MKLLHMKYSTKLLHDHNHSKWEIDLCECWYGNGHLWYLVMQVQSFCCGFPLFRNRNLQTLITCIGRMGNASFYLIDIFDAGVMKVGSLLSMLRRMLSMLRLVGVLRRVGVMLGVILVMLHWLLCVPVQQLTTNLLREHQLNLQWRRICNILPS